MGKIYIVGLGPGNLDNMTIKAKKVLDECKFIVGYKSYIDLIKPILEDKTYIESGMTEEVKRCEEVIKIAVEQNENVCLISSGDSGIYGMAGIMIEKCARYPKISIEIIPGVTAITAAASLVGAPLMNDFAIISLSDLLTPWKTIIKRIELACMADFVIGLYNPKSKSRTTQLEKAVEIIARYRSNTTPVAIVKNAGRENQKDTICMLAQLLAQDIDMATTIIIGNSKTYIINNKMVTPRGYKNL